MSQVVSILRQLSGSSLRRKTGPHAGMARLLLAVLLGSVMVVVGCGDEEKSLSYTEQVTQERVTRDMEMRSDRTVIPPRQRASFRGLDYFDIDSTYHFVLPLNRFASTDTVMMAESTGGVAPQVRVGTVAVPFPQKTDTLTVFEVTEGKDRGTLWIPFTDATNGGMTYKLGRYVDLETVGEDSIDVDFNLAYNPTCAYNPQYACPIPPEENDLSFAVRAGEKTPRF